MRAITSEQRRILVAAADGRLKMTISGRYAIDGEAAPKRRDRERLQSRGYITRPSAGGLIFTEKGLRALESAPVEDEVQQEQMVLDGGSA